MFTHKTGSVFVSPLKWFGTGNRDEKVLLLRLARCNSPYSYVITTRYYRNPRHGDRKLFIVGNAGIVTREVFSNWGKGKATRTLNIVIKRLNTPADEKLIVNTE